MGKFASTGVVVGQTKRDRRAQVSENRTSNSITMGKSVPRQREGKVGDITVREISGIGLRCFIKTNSGWFDINSMVSQSKVVWRKMNLTGNWAQSAGYTVAAYYKDKDGFVHLKGGITNASGGATDIIFTLPEGYRPSSMKIVAAAHSTGQASFKIAINGQISFANGAYTTLSFLDGIKFYAGQEVLSSGGGGGGVGPGGGGSSGGITT